MEKNNNTLPNNHNNKNKNFDKISNINDFKEIIKKVKLIKQPEQKTAEINYSQFFPSIKHDNKTHLLLTRTFYMKEFEIIEQYINNEQFLNNKCKLNNEEYTKLIYYFNKLLILHNLYINNKDYEKSLQILNKIVNILKNYIINKIG